MNWDLMIGNLAVITWHLVIILRIFAKVCLSLFVVFLVFMAYKTLQTEKRRVKDDD